MTTPVTGAVASQWLRRSSPAKNSATARGGDHVAPWSSETEMKMSVSVPLGVRSIQAQLMRPRCEPLERSTSQAGYTNARRLNSAGMPMSKGMPLGAITSGVPHVAPPSKDELKVIVLAAMSFQAAYTCPCGPVVTVTPIALPGPLGSSMRVVVKVTPWSRERARRTPPLEEPPTAASQPMYTLSRKGLPAFWSAVIIGLSLKWFSPLLNSKKVTCGQVLPPSVERATAISVPLMLTPFEGVLKAAPKKTTM